MEVILAKAEKFANAAHEAVGQRRKHTGEPYIVHPVAVMKLVAAVPHTQAMLIAALLHDTVEDTEVSLADVEAEFGAEVSELVGWLTDVSSPQDGNRTVRKAMDRAHTAKAPAAAKTVKLADLIHNSECIVANDPKFAPVYMAEKEQLLLVLKEGDPTLWGRAHALVEAYRLASRKLKPSRPYP